jgi:hypothetical protein
MTYLAISVWKDSPVKKVADLKGRRISPGIKGEVDLLPGRGVRQLEGQEIHGRGPFLAAPIHSSVKLPEAEAEAKKKPATLKIGIQTE